MHVNSIPGTDMVSREMRSEACYAMLRQTGEDVDLVLMKADTRDNRAVRLR